MENKRFNELAKEAVELIKEYGKISELLTDGDNLIECVSISNDNESIVVKELHEDEENIYELAKISSVLAGEMMFGRLYDIFGMEIDGCMNSFDELDKGEFINRIGSLYHGQLRCEKIYKRLQEIEKEV